MTPDEFIAAIAPAAQKTKIVSKIPASFTIAQAALESTWGRSQLAQAACNLFGVKADASWGGATLSLPTTEYVKGQPVTVQALWRKYPDWHACTDDHAKFLTTNKRYLPAFSHAADSEAFAQAIQLAGYATDPNYASKLIAVIRTHNLKAYDG